MVNVSGLQSSVFELLLRGVCTQGWRQGKRDRSSCAQNPLPKNMVYKCLANALFDEALHFLELQC